MRVLTTKNIIADVRIVLPQSITCFLRARCLIGYGADEHTVAHCTTCYADASESWCFHSPSIVRHGEGPRLLQCCRQLASWQGHRHMCMTSHPQPAMALHPDSWLIMPSRVQAGSFFSRRLQFLHQLPVSKGTPVPASDHEGASHGVTAEDNDPSTYHSTSTQPMPSSSSANPASIAYISSEVSIEALAELPWLNDEGSHDITSATVNFDSESSDSMYHHSCT